jgi:hypothetical protein
LIQLPSHARKLHPQRGVRDRIAAGDTILTDTPSSRRTLLRRSPWSSLYTTAPISLCSSACQALSPSSPSSRQWPDQSRLGNGLTCQALGGPSPKPSDRRPPEPHQSTRFLAPQWDGARRCGHRADRAVRG